jgi:hypothetical protein
MKKLLTLAVIAFSLASASAFAETLTGVVSDAMCAKNPAKASSPEHAACAAKCIKGGSPAVLIVDGRVYQVSNPDKIAAFAGEKITVDGSVSAGTITVSSVKH